MIRKLAVLSFSALAATLVPAQPAELILCGQEEVFIIDTSQARDGGAKKVWSWRAAERPELPAHMRTKYRTTDECKPVDGGRRILITASSDGIALVERASGRVEFYASAANAHSAEMLPGERIAVAASHRNKEGDRLLIFDIARPEKIVFETSLTWGHGVVWDQQRRVLWALSGEDLRAYELRNWDSPEPSLGLLATYPLPAPGGHDLYPVPGSPDLTVTANSRSWLFHRDKRAFTPHPLLADLEHIKSIATHPATGQTVFVQADPGGWWTDRVRFLKPESTIQLPDERLYKARWAEGPR